MGTRTIDLGTDGSNSQLDGGIGRHASLDVHKMSGGSMSDGFSFKGATISLDGTHGPVKAGGASGPVTDSFSNVHLETDGSHWILTDGVDSITLVGATAVVIDGQTYRLVDHFGSGEGGHQSIAAGIAAAGAGDIVMVAEGTYAENVTVNKSVTLQGVGDAGDVVIEGTFHETNGVPGGTTVGDYLQTAGAYSGSPGNGVTISANDVTLKNLTIDDFLTGVELGSNDGLTIDGVVISNTVNGVRKGTAAVVTDFTMEGGEIRDSYIGMNIAAAVDDSGDFSGVIIDGTLFEALTEKGIYVEQLSDAEIMNIVMNDVGNWGRGPAFGGTQGEFGCGIDINLKHENYTTIDIHDFTFTDVGYSNKDGGAANGLFGAAIVVKARDDAPTYSPAPATLDGITIHDGSIDGTSTGIRYGEPGKTNAGALNDLVTNVTITNADNGDYDNRSLQTVDVVLGSGSDVAVVNQLATGIFNFTGGFGDDDITAGNALGDTAKYTGTLSVSDITYDGMNNQWTVAAGAEGTDTLAEFEKITDGGGQTFLLVDPNGSYTSIQAAVNAASAGDIIIVAAGTYTENVTVNKSVTIVGANYGVDSDDTRGAESILSGGFAISADGVVIDGMEVQDGRVDFGFQRAGFYITGAYDDVSVLNSIVHTTGAHGEGFQHGLVTPFGADVDNLTITGNHFEGWGEGMYLNPGPQGATIDSNTFVDNGNHIIWDYIDDNTNSSITDNDFGASVGSQVVATTNPADASVDMEAELVMTGNTFQTSTSPFTIIPYATSAQTIYGTAGEDRFRGDFNFNADVDETFVGRGGNDRLVGGDGDDTGLYADTLALSDFSYNGTLNEWTVTTDTEGADTLVTMEKVTDGGGQNYLLVDEDGSYTSLQAAVDAASDGDIIIVAAGTYTGDVTVDKAVTIVGANYGVDGAGARGDESVVQGTITVTATSGDVVIDGVEVHNTSNNSTQFIGVRIQNGADVTVTNCLFFSTGPNGNAEDRAINMDTTVSGTITISNNFITGDSAAKYGTGAWQRGVWSDGTEAQLNILDNTFQYVRSGINMDGYDDATVNVSGNSFYTGGTGIAMGLINSSAITGIHDNTFYDIDSDFNLRNEADAQTLNLMVTNNVAAVFGADADGIMYVYGTAGADVITGTDNDDILDARDITGGPSFADTANNTLNGLDGADFLIGSNGNDSLYGGDDDDAGMNRGLLGGAGEDTLDGGSGADAMAGGLGFDTYYVDNIGDTASEAGGGGKDTVISSVDFVLDTKVEHLTLVGSAINGTGNGSKNQITGNGLDNNLDGDAKKDNLTGKGGNDVLTGGTGDDALSGGAGTDTIIGGTGGDIINGGGNKDTMTGGANGDTFAFSAVSDTANSNANADVITDFVEGGQDMIDLSGIDAITGGGDNAFAFVGGSAFSNTAGELRMYTDGGNTYVAGDVNGDGLSDFIIRLNGSHSLAGTDFDL